MAYPTAITSFSNKNAGDVIQPAHVNDLQTEVTAVETGLLNGFTHAVIANAGFQSSNSTFATRPVMPPPDAAKVFLASTITIGSSVASTIAWTAQDFLTNSSIHSTTTNPERLTPQSTGIYQFAAQLSWTANSTGFREIDLVDSSGGQFGSIVSDSVAVTLNQQAIGYKRFDALGGYAVVRASIGAGVSTLSLSSGLGLSWFAMHKL